MSRKDFFKYLSNKGNLESLSENKRLVEEVDLVLKLYVENSDHHFDAEEDWKALRSKIIAEKEKENAERALIGTSRNKRVFSTSKPDRGLGIRRVLQMAAVLLVAAMVGILTLNNSFLGHHAGEDEIVYREVAVDKGQRTNMVLSDGTNVSLNADSRLRLPEVFSSEKREVFLFEGEAFFEVSEDPARPFLIHSNGAVIRVLGTSFSVRAYPEDEYLRVAVKEGTVSLASDQGEMNRLTLSAEQLGLYSLHDKELTSEYIEDMDLFLSWIEGYFKFKGTPMHEVAKQLERRYNVKVFFSTPELKDLRLTAELKSRSMNNVLNVLSASLGISFFEEDWKKITFIDRDSTSK